MHMQFLGKFVGYDIHDPQPQRRHERRIQCSCSHSLDSTFSCCRHYMHRISYFLSQIMASRVVRRLYNFNLAIPEV
jgi:hypothetical protein